MENYYLLKDLFLLYSNENYNSEFYDIVSNSNHRKKFFLKKMNI